MSKSTWDWFKSKWGWIHSVCKRVESVDIRRCTWVHWNPVRRDAAARLIGEQDELDQESSRSTFQRCSCWSAMNKQSSQWRSSVVWGGGSKHQNEEKSTCPVIIFFWRNLNGLFIFSCGPNKSVSCRLRQVQLWWNLTCKLPLSNSKPDLNYELQTNISSDLTVPLASLLEGLLTDTYTLS